MRKILVILVSVIFSILLAGCGGTDGEDGEDGEDLMWSSRVGPKNWSSAVAYCDNLTTSKGYSDWSLPNIDALRTLIRNCPNTSPDGKCKVSSGCLSGSFSDGCRDNCENCGSSNPTISRLDDSCELWSSSVYLSSAWYVDFTIGKISFADKSIAKYFRCVRTRKSGDEPDNQGNFCAVQGAYRCDGNMLQKCDQEKWKNIQKCGGGQICNYDLARCEDRTGSIDPADDSGEIIVSEESLIE